MPCLIVNLLFLQKYWQSGQEEGTYLTVEWTNQHGCGGNEDNDPHKLNCNMVIQYMVMDYDPDGICSSITSLYGNSIIQCTQDFCYWYIYTHIMDVIHVSVHTQDFRGMRISLGELATRTPKEN